MSEHLKFCKTIYNRTGQDKADTLVSVRVDGGRASYETALTKFPGLCLNANSLPEFPLFL